MTAFAVAESVVELKPCPSGHTQTTRDNNNIYGSWWVKCRECSWRTAGDTEVEAIAAWDTRAPIEGDTPTVTGRPTPSDGLLSELVDVRQSLRAAADSETKPLEARMFRHLAKYATTEAITALAKAKAGEGDRNA
jgi:hypothetical protein